MYRIIYKNLEFLKVSLFMELLNSIQPPEEISIEFCVKIAVKSGKITALSVEGGGEVQVTVKAI